MTTRVLGEKHPNTLTVVDNLGSLYRAQGKYSQAESVFNKTLEARRAVLGEKHPDVLSTMANLAVTYLRQGKYVQAEPIALKALESRRQVLGIQNPVTMDTAVIVALIQYQRRKYVDAEQATREALSGYEKIGTDDWRRYRAMTLLGATLAGQGKYMEAEPLLLSGHEGMVQRVTMMTFENRSALDQSGKWIVQLYQDTGRPVQAAEWAEKVRQRSIASPK